MNDWVLLTIVATVLWASTNILDKYILSKLVKNPLLPLIFSCCIGFIVAVIIFYLNKGTPLAFSYILVALVAGMCYTVAIFLYFKAVLIEDISKIVALWYLAPLFTALFGAIFLHEILTLQKYLGLTLLVIGAFMIELKEFRFTQSKGLKLMIISSIFLAVNYVAVKYALHKSDFWTIFAWARVGSFAGMIPLVYIQRQKIIHALAKLPKKAAILMSVSESASIVGIVFITAAAVTGYATLVNAFSSIQPLFVFIFTIILSLFFPTILKEVFTKKTAIRRLLAIMCTVVGAMLVV